MWRLDQLHLKHVSSGHYPAFVITQDTSMLAPFFPITTITITNTNSVTYITTTSTIVPHQNTLHLHQTVNINGITPEALTYTTTPL
jgi:hypothetical protein